MSDETVPDPTSTTSAAREPAAKSSQALATEPGVAIPAQPVGGSRRSRSGGSGAMGMRLPDDVPTARRELLERAANEARSTGRRFDLMRYLRLRRKQPRC